MIQLNIFNGLVKTFFIYRFYFVVFFIAIRNTLTRIINNAKDFLIDPTKNMNKLNKDDKVKDKYQKKENLFFLFIFIEKNGKIC